ncbi:PucR family transcriptional regulator [Rudaeicoccus suwonensis]|uniref:PucR-like helix-turn-helix protein n=1 Tax=Rudaeicoccus suwonensis TaxID=657409 RepID=A0A561E3G7_9MICO|nr:PucR family transcriptional regulator [Rudaeicoccus suwonensis]TWE10152.1 PucR-like helix-turn-helix protein [Rudaeicoccus suwonensis]
MDESASLIGAELPWSILPREVSALLATALPDLVEEIIQRIPQEVPEYARPLEGDFGTSVRRGVEIALRRLFIDLPGRDEPALRAVTRTVYRQIGVGEARTGRSLEALLSAYRLGARVTFRAVSAVAERAGLEPRLMLPLGESIFVYIDEISAASVEGFTEEQSRQVGERDRRRELLLRRLLSGNIQEVEIRRLAARCGWTIPARVVAVVLAPEEAEGLRLALGDQALISSRTGQVVALAAAPASTGARSELARALSGRGAWVGPACPWDQAAESHRAAVHAAAITDLADDGGDALWVSDHLAAIVLQTEPELIKELAAVRFEPMAELRPAQQERLAETLLAWLRHRGERARIAEELHVHPQTVGYRLTQLREVFGDDLDDPDARFELELVLRAGHRPESAG